jgi:hypothetical protein
MRYQNGVLLIEDLNPEMRTQWVLGRWELFCIGLRATWVAIFA